MAQTKKYKFELPDPARNLSDEIPAIGRNFEKADAALAEQAQGITGKAAAVHRHEISDVTGLQAALNKKADADEKLKFADLSDVSGFDLARIGYVAVKTDKGIEMRSPQATIGNHKHRIADIIGLDEGLSSYGRKDQDNIWQGKNKFYGPVMINFPDGESHAGGLAMRPDKGGAHTELGYLAGGGVRVYIENAGDVVKFTKTGESFFKDTIHVGDAKYGYDGNSWGTVWKNWGADDALAAISKRIEERATAIADDRQKWCVTNTRFSGWIDTGGWGVNSAHQVSGHVVCGAWRDGFGYKALYLRCPQVYYPGRGWVIFGGW